MQVDKILLERLVEIYVDMDMIIEKKLYHTYIHNINRE